MFSKAQNIPDITSIELSNQTFRIVYTFIGVSAFGHTFPNKLNFIFAQNLK
jgi:hypothetical protein